MMLNQEEKWLLQEKHQGKDTKAFQADLESLRSGMPLGYVIGHVPFLDCRVQLDSHPLIPRPETEYWAEKAISEIMQSSIRKPRVLDLCSGSGAIGLAVAKYCQEAEVVLAEIDPAHLPTIKKNAEDNLSFPLEIIESDLFEHITDRFDFILTNPPYIDPALDRAQESVKAHEPHSALYGGRGGMEVINKIISAAPRFLNPGGQLWIEHEPEQVKNIKESAEAAGFRAVTHEDQYGVRRYSVLTIAPRGDGDDS